MTCPYCRNPLPDMPERFCPNCGGDLRAPGAVAPPPPLPVPVASVADAAGEVATSVPLGWIEITTQVLMQPRAFFKAMPRTGGLGGPLLYGLALGVIGALVGLLYQVVLRVVMGPVDLGGQSDVFLQLLKRPVTLFEVISGVVSAPFVVAAGLFISAAITHLMLLMLGGATHGFEATFRVVCYAQAAALARIVPLCGDVVVYPVYSVVLNVIGLSEAHGISSGKAAAAILLPLLFICCCCFGLGFFFFGAIASFVGHAR